MFKITPKGIKVYFKHYGLEDNIRWSKDKVSHTQCFIEFQDLKNPKKILEVRIGYAWCSPKDNFNKETGRKLALKRALDTPKLTKEQRTEIWKAYFEVKNN
jgi:hypothetical protein